MDNWYELTRIAAYHLWELTGCEQTLDLWDCAEGMACYFEQANILDMAAIQDIQQEGVESETYKCFMRNVAYRLHWHTGNPHTLANWFLAEKILECHALTETIMAMASLLSVDNINVIDHVRSEAVRVFYNR